MAESTLIFGRMENPPVDMSKTEDKKICRFILTYESDFKSFIKVPCMAFGDIAKKILMLGTKGSLWALKCFHNNVVGTYLRNNFPYPILELVVKEAKILEKPSMSGIGIDDLSKNYSPIGMNRQYQKKRRKNNG